MRALFLTLTLSFFGNAAFAAKAPFPETFVDVPASKFTEANLKYYRDKKEILQTVTYYQKDGKEYIAGSFNNIQLLEWDGYINLSQDELKEVDHNVRLKGKVPRQWNVTVINGKPSYSVIYQGYPAGWPSIQGNFDMTDSQFNDMSFQLAQQGYSIIDQSTYDVNGVRLHAASFQKDDEKRMFWGYDPDGVVQDTQRKQNLTQWWARSVDASTRNDGANQFSAIYGLGGNASEARFGITAVEFKAFNDAYAIRGWHVVKVKGHNGLFSAVWSVEVLP